MKSDYENYEAVFHEGGIKGLFKWFFFEAKIRLLGLLVAISGNVVKINGLRIYVDTPALSLVEKGLLHLGIYEREEINAATKYLSPSIPIIELGGFIGVLSCITNKMLHNPNNHIVVEPNPQVYPLLIKNRNENECKFQFLNYALSYEQNAANFYLAGMMSSLKPVSVSYIKVSPISLGNILRDHDFVRASLICDIEGGEVDLIGKEIDKLMNHIELLIIELHPSIAGSEKIDQALIALKKANFQQLEKNGYTYVFRNRNLV